MEKFNKGEEVEVSSQEPGFEDSWYVATITRRLRGNKYHVEYKSLVDETESYNPLKETVDFVQLRSLPPKQTTREFELNDVVDAFLNDGWWKGVVTKILSVGSRYSVFFSPAKEEKEFDQLELRAHLDWIHGNWVTPTSQNQEMVVTGQDERSVHSPNPTEQSTLSTDMETPQTPNGVSEPALETKLQGLGGVDSQTEKVLEKKRGRSIRSSKIESVKGKMQKSGSTKALRMTFQSKGHSALTTDMEIPQTPNGVSEPAQETELQGLGGVDIQTGMVLEKKRGRPIHSSKIESVKGKKQKSGSTKALCRTFQSKGYSALTTDMETPQTPNGVSDPAQATKLPGLGGADSQTEKVLESIRGLPICSSKRESVKGKKQKSGSTKAVRRTFQSKDIQTECTLSSSRSADEHQHNSMFLEESQSHTVKDIGGPKHESTIKLMTDIRTEFTPFSSRISDEHQPLSIFFKKSGSHIVKDIGGVVDKEVVDVLKRKCGGPKGSSNKASVKGPGKEYASKEMTGVRIECKSLSSHIAEERQPLSMFPEKSSSQSNGGTEYEAASVDMMVAQIESLQLLSHTETDNEPLSLHLEKSNSSIVKDDGGVSPVNQLMPNAITLLDASMDSIVLPASSNMVESSSFEECTIFNDQYQCDNASADERASHSADITPNTFPSPMKPDEGSPPFIKNSHLWGIFESMEVFRLMPQKPHFLPLEKYDEELREGYAVGHMLNFANLVERTWKAKLDESRSMFENKLKALHDLEELGFTGQPVRLRLEELLKIKDSYSELEDRSSTAYMEAVEEKRKLDEVQESIIQLNKKLQPLLMEKEIKGSNIAELQRKIDTIKGRIQGVKLDFDSMVRSPMVNAHHW